MTGEFAMVYDTLPPEDSDPTEIGDRPSFHEALTPPMGFAAAAPAWPHSVWLVLWSDGTVDSYDTERRADELLRFWPESEPMKLSEGHTCWAVAKREVVL